MRSSYRLLPLFLVIVIDSMGLGILFPIISDLFINKQTHFLSFGSSLFVRELLFGITISIYMFSWFFGATFCGDLSDAIGRKKTLLLCLISSMAGYFISGIGIVVDSIFLLILGRVLAGFTAGSQTVAQAAIIDVSDPANRAKNLGYVVFAVMLGLIMGPFIGGVLSDNHLVSWFDDDIPLFFAALLALMNYFLLRLFFSETSVCVRPLKINITYPLTTFIDAFRNHQIRLLSTVLLLETVGWSEYYTYSAQLLLRRFNYTVSFSSFFLVVMGLGFSVGFGYLVNVCVKYFELKKCVFFNLLFSAGLLLITAMTHSLSVLWISAFFVGVSMAILYSSLLTLFSNQVSTAEQGWIMGVANSVSVLSFGLTVLLSGFAADWNPALPMIIGFFALVGAAIVLRVARTQ